MSTIDNPFTRVYDAVWNALFEGTDVDGNANALSQLVKPGNRVDFNTNDINPMKNTLATADAPEVILVDEGGQCNLHANSGGTSYKQYISLYSPSGTWVYGITSAVNWYVFCNMSKIQTLVNAVTWRGEHPVKNIELVPIQTITNNPLVPKTMNGFTLVWRLQIELRFLKANMTYTEGI